MGSSEILQVLHWIKATLSTVKTPMLRTMITPKKVGQDLNGHLNDSGIGKLLGFEVDALLTEKSQFLMVYRKRGESRPSLKRILFIWSLSALIGRCLLFKGLTSFPFILMRLFGVLMNMKRSLQHLLIHDHNSIMEIWENKL